jgi:RimJ/RimL family protein N-acetyltransferase
VLRRPAEDDAKAMIDYLNQVGGESDNLLFGKNEFNLTVEQEMQFINKINNDENTLMLISLINNSIVSIAQISCYQRKRISHNCEIAISVMKQYWQVGIGSAVMDELIQFAKNHKNIRNIGLGVKASNERAIRLYEKFDFVKVGYHKDYFKINDEYDDLILMDLYLDK